MPLLAKIGISIFCVIVGALVLLASRWSDDPNVGPDTGMTVAGVVVLAGALAIWFVP